MGTLGFSGALLGADLAAKNALGAFWWMPLPILGFAALFCLGPTLGLGINLGRGTDLGPTADTVYRAYPVESAPTAVGSCCSISAEPSQIMRIACEPRS